MRDTSARLLRLLSLLQARRFWTGVELAQRLEVAPRTVRRDVERLRSLGYPVSSSVGVAGGYQLDAGATLPPLLLDDGEALAIAIGLRTVASTGVRGAGEAAVRALAKLERVLPSRVRRRVRDMRDAVVPLAGEGPQIDTTVLMALAAASRDQLLVNFSYLDRRGKATRRRVEPHGLVPAGPRWYLVAHDLEREDWRTFRVDRIQGQVKLGSRFTKRELPDQDVAAFVSRSLGSGVYRYNARVVVHAPLQRVAERVPGPAGRLSPISKRRCLLESGADSLSGLASFIGSLGEDVEILGPPELVTEVRALSERLSRAAERSSGE